jgi:hypothetical protein
MQQAAAELSLIVPAACHLCHELYTGDYTCCLIFFALLSQCLKQHHAIKGTHPPTGRQRCGLEGFSS